MTRFATFLNPALVDNEGLNKYLSRLFTAGVATSFNANSWKVVQRGAGANMSVDISVGDGFLILPTGTYGYWAWTDALDNVAVTAANATNPRIDVVIAKIVTTTTTTSNANSPGALVFQVMAGTPSGSPVAMSDATIQSTIGSGVPWIKLGTLNVPAASTSVVTANIADARTGITSISPVADSAITTAKIANAAVTPQKLSNTYRFRAYRTASQTLTSGGYTKILFDTESYDPGNVHDSVSNMGRFVAPVAGTYHFSASVLIDAVGATIIWAILYKNGVAYSSGNRYGATVAGTSAGSNVADDIPLAAGDYVEVYAFCNGAAPLTIGSLPSVYNYFSGHFVSV